MAEFRCEVALLRACRDVNIVQFVVRRCWPWGRAWARIRFCTPGAPLLRLARPRPPSLPSPRQGECLSPDQTMLVTEASASQGGGGARARGGAGCGGRLPVPSNSRKPGLEASLQRVRPVRAYGRQAVPAAAATAPAAAVAAPRPPVRPGPPMSPSALPLPAAAVAAPHAAPRQEGHVGPLTSPRALLPPAAAAVAAPTVAAPPRVPPPTHLTSSSSRPTAQQAALQLACAAPAGAPRPWRLPSVVAAAAAQRRWRRCVRC